MNLNYEKIREKVEHGGNQWTSYSDLFLVLSVVFLLLYVVSNLRSGTNSIASQSAINSMKTENEELKKQIKTYEVLRDDYVKKGASSEEIQVYRELMGKLTLLEDDAKKERKELFQKARDAQEKEQNLNRYQQMVKNIISANLVAQSRLKKRDDMILEKEVLIEEKQQVIAERDLDIQDLNREVSQRETEIASNNQKIANIESELEKKIHEVQKVYRAKKSSEVSLNQAIARLRQESQQQIESLNQENSQVAGQLQAAQTKLAEKSRESERLMTQLQDTESQVKKAAEDLAKAHQQAIAREKAAFEEGMGKARLSAEAKLAQERAYRASIEQKNKEYNDRLQELNDQLGKTRGKMKDIEGQYQASLGSLQKTNDALQKGLQASQDKLNEQRRLAQRIKENFKKSGVDADVDMKTGDVTINFANEYFDTGRADLKNGMKATLERLVPVYARSVFDDPKVAKRLSSVEIIGFASPTYKGRYVDPDSLSPEDRSAINFNMDLSYQRAKSIFEYVFDTNKMTFENQQTLLPLAKVSGRSYLANERLKGRDLSSVKDAGYCQMYDCKKSQKVIIKFNLKDE